MILEQIGIIFLTGQFFHLIILTCFLVEKLSLQHSTASPQDLLSFFILSHKGRGSNSGKIRIHFLGFWTQEVAKMDTVQIRVNPFFLNSQSNEKLVTRRKMGLSILGFVFLRDTRANDRPIPCYVSHILTSTRNENLNTP